MRPLLMAVRGAVESRPTITAVGNYGISIQWSDSHATGIYRFDFLREICPCPECAARER